MARISEASEIYAAAEMWMRTCLVDDGSMFLPEQRLWTLENVNALRNAFTDNPIEGEAKFEEKFKQQLVSELPEVKQLAAEMLWVLFLFPRKVISADRKRDLIYRVWNLSFMPPSVPITAPAIRSMTSAALMVGIGYAGLSFDTQGDRELEGLIDAVIALKEKRSELPSLDPRAVGELVDARPEIARRNIRNVLLHLLYPDAYESIASSNDKRKIVEALAEVIGTEPVSTPMVDVDRQLLAIRSKLQNESPGKQIDFYNPEIRARWDPVVKLKRPGRTEAPAKRSPKRQQRSSGADPKSAEEAVKRPEPDLVAQEARAAESASNREGTPQGAVNDETRAAVWVAHGLATLTDVSAPANDLLFASLIHLAWNPKYGSPAAGAVEEQMRKSLAARHESLKPAEFVMAHHGLDPRMVLITETGPWPVPALTPVLEAADQVRTRVGRPRFQLLSPRHILTVLLRPGPHSVIATLRELGFDPAELRAALLESILMRALGEDREEWRRLLEIDDGVAPDVALYAGFSTDALRTGDETGISRKDDRLNVMRDVTALAEVLAARETKPPLAVGLFGDWGTGKSFFMELMRQEIDLLGKENPSFYCERVVQVWFNAWHYMEANLWASLAARVFEELSDHLEKKWEVPDERTQLFMQLEQSEGVLAEAVSERDEAKAWLKGIRQAVIKREQSLAGAAKIAFDTAASALRGDQAVQSRMQEVTKEIGLPDAQAAVEKAAEQGREVLSLGRRIAAIAHALGNEPVLLGAGIVVFAAVTGTVGWVASQKWDWGIVPGAIAGLGTGLAAARAVITPVIRQVRTTVGWLEGVVARLRDRAETERRERELTAQRDLMRLETREREARARVEALNREIDDLRAGKRLQRFILERHTSAEYRQHLGLVNLIRKDFEQLSRLLSESEKESAASSAGDGKKPAELASTSVITVEPAADAGPAPISANAGDPQTPAGTAAQGDGTSAPLPKIDRIILYIDDLDRCPEDRVVQVLQAVHLLLAFPLFVVVVGVDSRWLLLSLEDHYAALRGTSHREREEGKDEGRRKRDSEWNTTPQNYLEKIFQIPFSLRPMGSGGFGELVSALLPIGDDEEEKDDERKEPQPRSRLASDGGDGEQEETRGEPSSPGDAESGDTGDREDGETLEDEPDVEDEEDDGGSADGGDGDRAGKTEADKGIPIPVRPNPLGLTISKGERDFIAGLHPLIASPRALKRFTNVYRFLRVQQRGGDLDRFRGTDGRAGEFQVVALLLGAVVGYPAEAAHLLRAILAKPGTDWWELVEKLGDAGAEEDAATRAEAAAAAPAPPFAEDGRRTLREALLEVKKMEIVGEHEPRTFAKWTREVARFSFQSGRILSIRAPEADDTKEGDAEPSAKEMA